MGINCPSCGGKMYFDIPNQVLKCSYCDTKKTIEEYKSNNESEVQQTTYDSVVYTCRNCGAELSAPDEQAVAYCSYCGSEQMMTAKHEKMLRPNKIIPFKKSKKQAKNVYAEALKGKLYVPKEFKDPQFLEGFRGIYLPYFSYNAVVADHEAAFQGKASYTKGGYDYTETHEVYAHLGGHSQEVNFDASSAFDDTLANEIAPFQAKDLTDFHDGYLAGLYADKATTDARTYFDAAMTLATESIYREIEKKVPKVTITKEKDIAAKKAKLGITAVDCEVSYFPVWFLTWRHKKRVAYSVMNGQTGKITMDIPVNKKMFFLISLAAAVLLFVILSVLPMFILPRTISCIAAVILLISSLFLRGELKQIYAKESHIYDYGDTQHSAKKKKMTPKEANAPVTSQNNVKTKKSSGWVWLIIPALYILATGLKVAAGSAELVSKLFSSGGIFVFIIIFPIQVVLSVFMIMYAARLEKKSAIAPAIVAPLILLGGIIVFAMSPAYDYWYFGLAMACLVALILNCLSSINYFNYLTTRPVPNFFRREGANNAQ